MDKRYSITDHPSDIGIKAWGTTPEQLFTNAAEGLYAVMTDPESIKAQKRIDLSIKEDCTCGYEEAMVSWLEELIFWFETEKLLLRSFRIKKLETGKNINIEAEAWGENMDKNRHKIRVAIKAVTYHGLRVGKNKEWNAQVLFDV